MKTSSVWFVALVVGCAAAQAADNASVKKAAQGKAEEINKALLKDDFAKVAALTHPKVVEFMGGREKMIAVMQAGSKDMKAKGVMFHAAKVADSSDPVRAGSDLFVVVPFQLEMKVPGGKLRQKSFVIGVSGDEGKSWVFVNGDLDVKRVKQVLPNLPEQLKLPEKQAPVFEKD